MKNDGGAAFPRTQWTGSDKNAQHRDVAGMTLRDWFAGQANEEDIKYQRLVLDKLGMVSTPSACRFAHADEMLAAREGKDG